MIDFILAPENLPFAVALGLMLAIAVLEGAMTLVGAGLSEAIDNMLPGAPDLDADLDIADGPEFDADLDIGDGPSAGDLADADGPDAGGVEAQDGGLTPLTKVLGWLQIGKVPFLVLLVCFLAVFGLAGFIIQNLVQMVTGGLLPSVLAAIPALAVAIPSIRVIGGGLAKLIPKDETSAVASGSFIGRIATITIGTAKTGQPAEARLTDQHGQVHYVMVVPDKAEDSLETGSAVLLVSKDGPNFRAIANTNPHLVDD